MRRDRQRILADEPVAGGDHLLHIGAIDELHHKVEQLGRDHHSYVFTTWMAGAGVKSGMSHGESDDFVYNPTKDPVHVHDFQATIMHLLGIDHEKFTFRFQGRQFRLTYVHGEVVKGVLA